MTRIREWKEESRRWDAGIVGRLEPHITKYEDTMITNHNSTTMQDEVQAPRPDPTPAAKPVAVEIPADPAAKVLACIAELDLDLDTVFERGLLYGLITIAAELRAIHDGIDDIAAVVVANDPKSQENNQ